MSEQLRTWANRHDLPPTENEEDVRLVLLTLADLADTEGRCTVTVGMVLQIVRLREWPSGAVTTERVRAALIALIAAGLVEIQPGHHRNPIAYTYQLLGIPAAEVSHES